MTTLTHIRIVWVLETPVARSIERKSRIVFDLSVGFLILEAFMNTVPLMGIYHSCPGT